MMSPLSLDPLCENPVSLRSTKEEGGEGKEMVGGRVREEGRLVPRIAASTRARQQTPPSGGGGWRRTRRRSCWPADFFGMALW